MTGRRNDDAQATRKARGSVQEAIGKLIGDDAARDRGAAEQRGAEAGAASKRKRP
ncbi:hypothetical protein [uncultured Sphingomonas sp.]|uniref:hypothetical protein n=1 Tax=uncultured Sphingomonas sp. TaxID=158754 RepID=UPI0030F72899